MAKRNKNTRKSKTVVLVAQKGDVIHVGIDVHKRSYHMAVWKNGKLASDWTMPSSDQMMVSILEPAREALQNVVYEAGPTGYGLARKLMAAGFPCRIVAPGKTPRAASKGNKSDRLDCRRLAEYSAKDMLKYVGIPTEAEDHERQLIRMRDDQMKKRKRIKQQIKSFLLYNSIDEPAGLQGWTIASVVALKKMNLPPLLRFRLDEFLGELEYYKQSLKRIEKELGNYEQKYAEQIEILRSHPGVGQKTSRQFIAEIYQPKRFSDSKQIASYLGLAPKVECTGDTRHESGVIKGGRGKLRAMLIECCWRWIRDDPAARKRYFQYLTNTGSAKKSIHAMARKMAIHLWVMLVRREKFKTPIPFPTLEHSCVA